MMENQMQETTEQKRNRMYQEAVMRAQQPKPQVAPAQPMPQAQPQQANYQPPPQAPSLSTQDLLRLQTPYKEYSLAEMVAGRQPVPIEQWAVNMTQGQ
jgi:hypothetical protein